MAQINVDDISTRIVESVDDAGDLWYAIKATVVNSSNQDLEVDVEIQGVDDEGFELTSVNVRGVLLRESDKILTERTFLQERIFEEIAQWQVKEISAFDM
jgi:hypothetical protein